MSAGLQRYSVWALSLILAQGLGASVAAKDAWFSLTTSNFNILSNSREAKARKLALDLEQFRAAYSQVCGEREVAGSVPITVIAFASQRDFGPFKPIYRGKVKPLDGFSIRSFDENLIALELGSYDYEKRQVIVHEYMDF